MGFLNQSRVGWVIGHGGFYAVLLALLTLAPVSWKPRFPPPVVVSLEGPPKTVETVDPRVCFHTRTTDEVDDHKIQRTFEMVRELGAPTIVEFLPWAYVENSPGNYNWYHPDRIIRHAEYQGLRTIARLGFAPTWLTPHSDEDFTTPRFLEEMTDRFAEYVAAFVDRYEGRIDTIIIWNEPNLELEWRGAKLDPNDYIIMLRKAYLAAHSANPDIIVLGAALAPTNAPPGGAAGGWNDLDYLTELYEAGANAYFDALAAHTYGFTQPFMAPPDPERLNFRRLELLREIMVAYGDGDKQVYVTESGWNDHPRWAYAVGPGERIVYTLDAYRYAAEHWDWVEAICLWAFRDPVATLNYPDYFTYVSQEFDPKPIYTALQAHARGWEMPPWLQDLVQSTP